VEKMRSRGLAIGTNTGYTRPMLDYLLARALEQGFRPDASLCPDDVPQGRPAPWMCYSLAMKLNVYPMSAMVKIGDTPVDISEGLNAGMWTIGLTRTGNEVGLTEEEWEKTSEHERLSLISDAEERLLAAGAHYVAGSLAECDGFLDAIQDRLDRGECPPALPCR
jgi:phosphonoacetaldehyde hydrolase